MNGMLNIYNCLAMPTVPSTVFNVKMMIGVAVAADAVVDLYARANIGTYKLYMD